MIVERPVADERKFPVIEEEPVVRDMKSRSGSDAHVAQPVASLERGDEIAIGVHDEVTERDIVRPELAADS
jgi:hypothetical protein